MKTIFCPRGERGFFNKDIQYPFFFILEKKKPTDTKRIGDNYVSCHTQRKEKDV